jgi:polyisoprenoid-binding protein YceI
MNKNTISFLMFLALVLTPAFLLAQSSNKHASTGKIAVNVAESKVNWIGKKPTGEHHGYVKLSSGELILNKNEITGGSFTIDLNSITNLDLQDKDMNGRLVGHLKSADFFDVARYATGSFVITKVSKVSGSYSAANKATHQIEGNLTLKGITKKISFDAAISVLKGKVTASAAPFTINRTDWGVNYQSKSIFAELKDQFIYDDMTLSIDLVSK